MHIMSDANGLPLLVGVSAGNTHDSKGLKPMVAGHQTRHDAHRGRHFKPQRLHAAELHSELATDLVADAHITTTSHITGSNILILCELLVLLLGVSPQLA
ncbi:hypothetical protein S1361_00825 [Streptomyces cyanogenus]|uniref:Transposase homolog n=1 Tax=Streptomyces cyanogenus TaxID=80860 RepID=A0ABX7THV9_STRCY|nr:hypothetical protein S1361_00825 [Streptomyces cyanogenus]